MKKLLLAMAVTTAVFATPSPVAAHTHSLSLPSTTNPTQALAGGHVEGADWHPLHCVVHIGRPGTFAFDQPNNPVDIFKVGSFSGNCASKPGTMKAAR